MDDKDRLVEELKAENEELRMAYKEACRKLEIASHWVEFYPEPCPECGDYIPKGYCCSCGYDNSEDC